MGHCAGTCRSWPPKEWNRVMFNHRGTEDAEDQITRHSREGGNPVFQVVQPIGPYGPTVVTDAEELRVKESDRIKKKKKNLKAMGAEVTEYEDGLPVIGPALDAALPAWVTQGMGINFYFGGTSLLIVVVVIMDFMSQVQSHLLSHQYEGLMKKAHLKGYGRSGVPR